jgi:hypothetical protein
MSCTAILWTVIVYAVGYFVWFGYAINRFAPEHLRWNGEEVLQALLALMWPICVAFYVPYRIFRGFGVRNDMTRTEGLTDG